MLSEESSLPYMGPVGSPLGGGGSVNRALAPQASSLTGRSRLSVGGGVEGGEDGGGGGGGGGDLRSRLLQARKSKIVRDD